MEGPDMRGKVTLKQITGTVIAAFLAMALLSLFFFGKSRNFFDVRQISAQELMIQALLFAFLFGLFFAFRKKLSYVLEPIWMATLWLVYLFFFSVLAPVESLAFGALLVSIPAVYISFHEGFTLKKESFSKNRIKLNKIFIYLNYTISLLLLVILIFKAVAVYEPYLGRNGSLISDAHVLKADWDTYFYLGLGIMAGLILGHIFQTDPLKDKTYDKKKELTIIAIVFIALLFEGFLLSRILVSRIQTLSTSTYDFGIFTQMFHNMRRFEGMVTTLERGFLLNHNFVHVSPIYYLMLPFFALFPYPETLQVLQVIVVASGVIPLYLIGKHLRLPPIILAVVELVYIFNPAIVSSSFFDLHENCFLAPLILFVLYYAIKQKTIGLIVSGILLLLVKEDAGIYLVFIGLYLIFGMDRKNATKSEIRLNIIHGLGAIVVAIVYFTFAIAYLGILGTGAMLWRYGNLNGYTDLGLFGTILSLFQNPSYFLATLFQPSKVYSMLVLFAGCAFFPFFVRNMADYLLLGPLVVVNFASNYYWQHQFGYQYFYGGGVLVIFVAMLAIKENLSLGFLMSFTKIKRAIYQFVFVALAISMTITIGLFLGRYHYVTDYRNNFFEYDNMRETLEAIPRDKKVVATSKLTTFLGDRMYLYDYDYYDFDNAIELMDYVIIDIRLYEHNLPGMEAALTALGYQPSSLSNSDLLVYEPAT